MCYETYLSISFVSSEISIKCAPMSPGEDYMRRAAKHFKNLPRKAGGEGVTEQIMGLF